MKPIVVITRTRPDADALAQRLTDLGYEPLLEPMLRVSATHAATVHDPMCVEALVVTSAQALRHLNTLVREVAFRHKPLYAVGPKTASLAIELGWDNVHDGGGDVRALGTFLKSRSEITPSSRLLHICGRDIARDTREILNDVPGNVLDWVVYETEPSEEFSPDFIEAMRTGRVKAALFYSARAASVFADHVRAYSAKNSPDNSHFGAIKFLCLSKAVVESLSNIPSNGTYAATSPDEDALVALLKVQVPA